MPKLTASFRALRAISVVTVEQLLKPILLMTAIILGALFCLTIFLSLSFSGWWLLLLIILVPLTVAILTAGIMLLLILRKIMPRELGGKEREKITGFSDKLLGTIEKSRYPYPVILFLIAKDIIRRKESSFLREMIGNSRDLTKEFAEIQDMFR